MNYKNGLEVLPPKLLNELQKYIQGEIIYIPKRETERSGWGEKTGTKKLLLERNEQIYLLYTSGKRISDLASEFCLSEDSIKKIIIKMRKHVNPKIV